MFDVSKRQTHFPAHGLLHIFRETASSTMDMARTLAKERTLNNKKILACGAGMQTNGRGTKGSTWASPSGNIHLTFAIPTPMIDACASCGGLRYFWALSALCALNTIEAHSCAFSKRALSHPHVFEGAFQLKWPNDVHFKKKKVAGVLIEQFESWFLLGLGVNILHAPKIADGGRPAACMADVMRLAPWQRENIDIFALSKQYSRYFIQTLRQVLVENRIFSVYRREHVDIACPDDLLDVYRQKLAFEVIYRDRADTALRYKPVRIQPSGALVCAEHKSGTLREFEHEYLF